MTITRSGAGIDMSPPPHTPRPRPPSPSRTVSTASSSITRQRCDAKVIFEENMVAIRRELRKTDNAIITAEVEMDSLDDALRSLQAEEQTPDVLRQIAQLQQDRRKKQEEIRRLRNLIEDLEDDKGLLQTKYEADLAKIQDEADMEQRLPFVDDNKVPSWMETTVSGESIDGDRIENPEKIEENHDQSEGLQAKTNAVPSSSSTGDNNAAIMVMMQTLQAQATVQTQAIQAMADMRQDAKLTSKITDKFLSRQVISKELPHFHGRPEQWPSFISEYQRTTSMGNLTPDENLQRLRKSLKGEALKAVECLMISPDNVFEVIETLRLRFGNPKHIIESLVSKVRSAPSVRDGKAQSLIEFGQLVVNLCSTIRNLDEEEHLKNPLLLKELVEKLSEPDKKRWVRSYLGNGIRHPDLTDFTTWIKQEMEVAYEVAPPPTLDEKPRHEKSQEDKKPWGQSWNKRTVHATGGRSNNKCNVCEKDGHLASECRELKALSPDDRVRKIMEKKLCLSCLLPSCTIQTCNKKTRCPERGCRFFHHKILHGCRSFREIFGNTQETSHAAQSNHVNINAINFNRLRYVPIEVSGPSGKEVVVAMLDDGSDCTLLDEGVRERIGVTGPTSALGISTVQGDVSHSDSRRVSLTLKPVDKEDNYKLNDVFTVPNLSLMEVAQDVDALKAKYPHLRKIPMTSFPKQKPKMLIGTSHWSLIKHLRSNEGNPGDPIAVKSNLGWAVIFPQKGGVWSESKRRECYHTLKTEDKESSDEYLQQLVKTSFSTEDFGVKILNQAHRSQVDQRAMQIMENKIQRAEDGKRWELPLLWKHDGIILPESKSQALRRLYCQEKKMDRDPDFASQMFQRIADYEEAGFIKKLAKEELLVKHPKEWYLPIFGVSKPNKPKIRLVYDAAGKSNGTSLNDNLCQGPDLNNPLAAILMRFRRYDIAYAGDIKDMFHRVFISPEDRPSQRFLWRGKNRTLPPDTYEMQVMIFGAASSPVCAQFVKNHNASLFENEKPEAAKAIQKEFYVDDFLHSSPTVEDAVQIIRDVIEIQESGGFCMCGWSSNNKTVLKSIPKELLSKDYAELEIDESLLPNGRVLGMKWDPNTDVFSFSLNFWKIEPEIINGTSRPTKRQVLKVVASVFDPLGLLGHLIIRAKILLQDIWRSGIGWDDQLTDILNDKWITWLQELENVRKVKIPRVYSPKTQDAISRELHVFVDGSEKAFSAVAILRTQYKDHVDCALVMSKTRVTPLKTLSIPKIELQAAVMGVRLANAIKSELGLHIDRVRYWSDSMTVLKWLQGDPRNYKQFVSHRVGEILESSEVEDWRWIPTKLNVADDATRDNYPIDLSSSSRYFCGEAFLKMDEAFWPQEAGPEPDEGAILEEMKKQVHATSSSKFFIDASRYSKYQDAVRVVAWWRRFVLFLKSKKEVRRGPLTVDELDHAQVIWMKNVQKDCFPEEMEFFNGGKQTANSKDLRKSRLRKLDPILIEGLICINGRIGQAKQIPIVTNHPIILDDRHPFVKLLVDYYHRRCGHQGKQTVASELRQKYWILNRTGAIKQAFRDCQICKIKRATAVPPKMGELPSARLEDFIRPFNSSGMDYFGPLSVTIGRRVEKRWGVIFTCLSTRAVHLELASSLTTDSAINAIRRFGNRRGHPSHIYSDNGKNFVGADNELKKALENLDQDKLESKLSENRIQWHFIPPAAPHMGGAWERLVGSVKTVLWKLLKEGPQPEETLSTFLTEVENILNSRPLLEVSTDPTDDQVLTPNHFLLGWTNGCSQQKLRNPEIGSFENHGQLLKKSWKAAQKLADQFWNLWVKSYLPTLVKRTKWIEERKPLNIGDLVIVVDDQAPRNQWMQGIIEATYPGKDGRIRSVDVRTNRGLYRRPVVKIALLEPKDGTPPTSTSSIRGKC